jgi:predicted enzyme related to lactoylglutathione lyase
VSETISQATGKVAWFEIPAEDTRRAREFYGSLFGWQFQSDDEQDYHMTFEAAGAIKHVPDEKAPTIYFGTDDIDAAVARVRALGGKAEDKVEIPGFGYYAGCTDTEGTRFSLYEEGGSE